MALNCLADVSWKCFAVFDCQYFFSYPDNYRDMAHELVTIYPQLSDSLGVPKEKATVSIRPPTDGAPAGTTA